MREVFRIAHIARREPVRASYIAPIDSLRDVAILGLGTARGRGKLDNTELAARFPQLASVDGVSDGIMARTGIQSRLVADADQDCVSMAVEASELALAEAGFKAEDINVVICSTSTPTMISPSTACQVIRQLAPSRDIPAYDLQAACSGYLYALGNAWDNVQQNPGAKVLVITTETMRKIVDIDDAGTSTIFGDAASATIVSSRQMGSRPLAVFDRPLLGAVGEGGSTLRVPLPGSGYVYMDGKRIFAEAIRRMEAMLRKACAQAQIDLTDLDLVVPHQANGRMIEAIRTRLGLPEERVWNEIKMQGNTSSSSIPLALDTVLRQRHVPKKIGLCAFGAGYTFGSAIMYTP